MQLDIIIITIRVPAAHRDRAYSFQFCSPTRSSLQSGRYPSHVNDKNADVTAYNPADPVSGFAAIPRNMTGIASKLKAAGYMTHQVGKWDAGMATWDHTPHGRGYDTSLGCADRQRAPAAETACRAHVCAGQRLVARLLGVKQRIYSPDAYRPGISTTIMTITTTWTRLSSTCGTRCTQHMA